MYSIRSQAISLLQDDAAARPAFQGPAETRPAEAPSSESMADPPKDELCTLVREGNFVEARSAGVAHSRGFWGLKFHDGPPRAFSGVLYGCDLRINLCTFI
jgi:hypothetical protein